MLNAYQRPDVTGPLVFTACAPDERHEIGILLVSVFLARRGIAARYLGPNLPLDVLAAVVAQQRPAVVVLSAQSRETGRKLRSATHLLTRGPPPHPQVVFGGQAFNDDAALRKSVDGTYVGPDAETAVTAISAMLGRTASAPPRRGGRRLGARVAAGSARRTRRCDEALPLPLGEV